MMRCPHCGHAAQGRFCNVCGAQISRVAPTAYDPPPPAFHPVPPPYGDHRRAPPPSSGRPLLGFFLAMIVSAIVVGLLGLVYPHVDTHVVGVAAHVLKPEIAPTVTAVMIVFVTSFLVSFVVFKLVARTRA
jgi:hypothetical protein